MKILITGATSKIGRSLFLSLARQATEQSIEKDSLVQGRQPVDNRPNTETRPDKIYLLTRNHFSVSEMNLPSSLDVEFVYGDLLDDLSFLNFKVDLCLHMAAVTHSLEDELYFRVNHEATVRLAQKLLALGCQKFIYVSSHTAGLQAGAYALSKFLSEKTLWSMPWTQLLILRPAEVVGVKSNEGLDQFEFIAKSLKIYPWLVSWQKIEFAPLKSEDLIHHLAQELQHEHQGEGKQLRILRGPQITSRQLMRKMCKKHKAFPVPVFVPLLKLFISLAAAFDLRKIPQDQVPRLLGARKQKPFTEIDIQEIIFESPFG